MSRWYDLSTSELAWRLIYRGWDEDYAFVAARNRDKYRQLIAQTMGGSR